MSNIRVLKFLSGEEVVAKVESVVNTDDSVPGNLIHTLTDPLALYMQQIQDTDEKGQVVNIMRPSIAPWAVHVEKNTVRIKDEHVLYNEPANDELERTYRTATGGIATPPQGLIVPK